MRIRSAFGRYGGSRKYGRSANLPPKGLPPPAEGAAEGDEDSASYGPAGKGRSDEGTRIRKPGLDEMGPGTDREVPLNFRERPAARIVVTGCAAQTEPGRFADMPEVALVLGNEEKLSAQAWRAHRDVLARAPFGITRLMGFRAVWHFALFGISALFGIRRCSMAVRRSSSRVLSRAK